MTTHKTKCTQTNTHNQEWQHNLKQHTKQKQKQQANKNKTKQTHETKTKNETQ